jgi:hypothetical protein
MVQLVDVDPGADDGAALVPLVVRCAVQGEAGDDVSAGKCCLYRS